MPADLTPIEARFKQILFLGLEEIQATKGALYLLDEEKFKLLTHYGYKLPIRSEIEMTDELVRHFKFQRTPLLLNAAEEDRRFTARMLSEDSTRMIVVPVYSHARLTALLDLRDKAGKKPFTQDDVEQAQRIVDRLLELFVEWDLFDHASLRSPEGELQLQNAGDDHQALSKLVAAAHHQIERGALRGDAEVMPFAEPHFAAAKPMLAAMLAMPGALLASFCADGRQILAARSTLADDALLEYERRTHEWFRKHNETVPLNHPAVQYPFGVSAPIAANRIASMSTAPVKSATGKAFLTIAFEVAPSADVVRMAEGLLRQTGDLLALASASQQLNRIRKSIAETLLQPPSQQYQNLAAHSYRVAGLAGQLGQKLGLTSGELENLELSAMLHDVGMRLLDYRRLYRKPQVTEEELRLMRAHNAVGAVVIAQSPLGKQIARDVYHHHDRFDSMPAGNSVPAGPRIIHVCEAFDAMTAPDSYKAPKPIATARDVIAGEAGRQFDPDVARSFVAMIQ